MHDTIEAKDELIDRYLNNQLDDPDRIAFELAMLEDEALLEQVQLLDAFKQGLIAADLSGSLPEAATATSFSPSADHNKDARNVASINRARTSAVLPFRTWIRQPFSLAASVLVAVLGLETLYTSYSMPLDSSTEISTVVLLEGMRGDRVADYSGPGPYLFQLDVGPGNDAESFAFSLYDAADQSPVVQQTDVPASSDGWVRLVLDDSLAGEYVAELRWTDNAGNPVTRQFPLHLNN